MSCKMIRGASTLCKISHKNIRHLGGTHDFQILSHGVAPMKRLSYPDFIEYYPSVDNLQMCESATSGCS
jgi:hypothetical protein